MREAAAESRGRRRRRWTIVAALVAAALVAFAISFDWNWLKGPVERYVSARTGRDFVIRGDLKIDLGTVTTVTAGRLALANADWSSRTEMARADHVRVDIGLWPLLRGRWVLPRIEVERPRLLLQRNTAGDANWRFDSSKPFGERPLYLGDLIVRDGAFELHDAVHQLDLRVDVESAPANSRAATPALVARGTGRHRDGTVELAGRIDTPPGTFARGRRYHVDVQARAGATRAHVDGELPAPVDVRHFELRTAISGQDLADLYPLLGIATPETPPYTLTGQLRRDDNLFRYRDFTGTVGDSDLSGDVSLLVGNERPMARGSLVSKRLDFDDLAGLIGAPPSTKPGESASPEQRAEARRRAARPLVLPDRPYNLQKLRSLDADLHFRAADVDAGELPIESIAAQLQLKNGLLHIKPLDLGIAGGRVTGSIRLDARGDPIATTAGLHARHVELPKLFPRTVPDSVGVISADMNLVGHGNSVASMFATADGELGIVMGRGRFSNLLLELAGLDVAESLKFLMTKDRTVKLRCAYADFDVDDGIMKTEAFAFDTTDTVVFGEGTLNLRNERLHLELHPRPKDRSLVSLRVPLEVSGTFKDPSVAPQKGPLAARVAAATALYMIAPPAALLALIETGPGDDVNCGSGGQGGALRSSPVRS